MSEGMSVGSGQLLRFRRPVPTADPAQPQAKNPSQALAQPFLLPAEDVVIHAITLPNLPPGQRRAAAAFAVEDFIAQPLDQVRVILGPQYPEGSGKWLVAVVDLALLARAAGHAGHAGLARPVLARPVLARPVLAEVMALPIPAAGWSVALREGRLLIRRADGSGFAVDPSLALPLWQMQGMPTLTGYGEGLPDDLPCAARLPWPEIEGLPPWSFDLAAITGRRPTYAKRSKWHWAAGFVAVALAAHLTLAALDVHALQRLAADSRQALAEAVAPYAAAGEDPVVAATRVLAAQGAATAPAFLSLATSAISALPPPDSGVSLRSLRFEEVTGRMVLAVIAPDITTLQAVEAALVAAGLNTIVGPASSRNGAAEAEMTVTTGAAP